MARSGRLLALLQALRGRRQPVTAAALAAELEVSLRTVYRDVASLMAVGANIQGEAGLGYVLGPGTFLPPLMFDETEADAVILGLRLVSVRADAELAAAAARALAKVEAVLPPALEAAVAMDRLLAVPPEAGRTLGLSPEEQGRLGDLGELRGVIKAEHKFWMIYFDASGQTTDRVVWPVALGFFGEGEMLVAWCELRQDFRHFRVDRIADGYSTGERYPKRRAMLMAEWRMQQEEEGC